MKNFKKVWMNSLSCLDNCYVHSIIVVILLLYSSELFGNINSFVGNWYHSSIVRFIVLLLIIYVAPKDTTIAILLALSYVISLHYKMHNENFISSADMNKNIVVGEENVLHAMKQPPMKQPPMQQPPMQQPPMQQPPMQQPPMQQNIKNRIESFSSKNMSNKKKEHFFPLTTTESTSNDFKMNVGKEHFFPLMNSNEGSQFNSKEPKMPTQAPNANLSKAECLNNYTPRFEAVGDICSPTATFQNELNAQGLNYPEGFDSAGLGSPLN